MSASQLATLVSIDDISLYPAVNSELIAEAELALGVCLPTDHRAALHESNGAQVFGGYFRLFGIGAEASTNLVKWNDPNLWKFAWDTRCSDYVCFAETAWGDQYAYNKTALMTGNTEVYFLDCLSMSATPLAATFSDFLRNEFIHCATDPYDALLKEARQILGELDTAEHLIYLPSPLLAGAEEITNVQRMNARSAMICNGDIAIQLDAGPADGNVKAVLPYEDGEGRMRLQLTWA